MSSEREELLYFVSGEIQHHISPVIGWLRMDAKLGRVDKDKDRLNHYRDQVVKAAESIVDRLMEGKEESGD